MPLITVVLYIAYKDEFKLAYEKLKVRFDEKARKRTRRAVQSLETITDMSTDPFIDDLDGHESIDGRNFHYLIVPGKYFLLVKMGVTSLSSEALAKRYKYSLGRGINIYAYEIKNGESINNDDGDNVNDDDDDDGTIYYEDNQCMMMAMTTIIIILRIMLVMMMMMMMMMMLMKMTMTMTTMIIIMRIMLLLIIMKMVMMAKMSITVIILFTSPIQIGLKRTTLELLTFKVFQDYRCWPTAEFFLKTVNETSGMDLVSIYRNHLKKISSTSIDEVKVIARSILQPEGRREYIDSLIAEANDDSNVQGNFIVFYIIMLRKHHVTLSYALLENHFEDLNNSQQEPIPVRVINSQDSIFAPDSVVTLPGRVTRSHSVAARPATNNLSNHSSSNGKNKI